ncbi:putative ribonuclease H-like domain-containing protein [Tanacetum coccineum]|uniref:Ribonuclease H-like domain-containing protein n=1 Tax=Tanacetum coccineum TaxID=301880 RepID=A0ABQ5AG47_9ASTR
MRPFGCPVTILNTLDSLGKFDRKADEGFFVGYFINRKAFRVFNTRTRKVEENLHITFLENKPNVAGSRPDWLFDIDLLTNSMNYEPVTTGNQTNKNACIKDNVDAVPTQQYILLPLLYDSPKSSEDAVVDDAGKKTNEEPANKGEINGQEKEGGASNKEDDQNVQDFRAALDNLIVQQKECYANSTNRDNIVSPSVNAVGQSFTNADDLPTDPLMLDLEDTTNLLNTGIFSGAYDDEDVGAESDLNNFETTMNVSPIPTTRIHKDHPKDQIIGDTNSTTQTRRMTKIFEELAMRLVDLPKGKHAIGTKWVYRNKKDKRWIVVKNKARLVAQGYTQEKEIDYDEVFAPDARIEAIRLFLAYASFMGFIVYQIDVKSAFLYGTIKEEVYVCQPPGFKDLQFPDKVYKVEKALYGLHQASRACPKSSKDAVANRARKKTNEEPANEGERNGQDKEGGYANSTNRVFTISLSVSVAGKSFTNADDLPTDPLMPDLKDTANLLNTSIFSGAYDDENVGAKADPNNLETTMNGKCYKLCQTKLAIRRQMQDELLQFRLQKVWRLVDLPKGKHAIGTKWVYRNKKDERGRIFRYLKGQPKLGLWYPRDSPFDLEAFSDSDYAGASLDRKSTTEGYQFLSKRLISWQCKKQTIVVNSTTEAEYVAAANCCGQGTDSGSGLRCQDTILRGAEAQTRESKGEIFRVIDFLALANNEPKTSFYNLYNLVSKFEAASKQSNDLPLSRVTILGSGEDNMKLRELMKFCTKVFERALD